MKYTESYHNAEKDVLQTVSKQFWCYDSSSPTDNYYHQSSSIRRILAGNKVVDHLILDLTHGPIDCTKTVGRHDEKDLSFVIGATYIRGLTVI